MHKKYMENNLYYSITSMVLLLSFYAYQYLFNWPLLKISGILGPERYVDLSAIQNFSNCIRASGIRVYEISDNCGGYQYSMGILYSFSYSHFSQITTPVAAIFLELPVIIASIFILFSVYKKSRKVGVFTTVALLAPGNWLLLERGNLDLLMLSLILIAGAVFRTRNELLGFIALTFSVFTKFYTAPLMLIFLLFGTSKFKKTIYLPITVVTYALSIYQIMHVAKFPSTWYVSFGSGSIGHWFNLLMEYGFISDFRVSGDLGNLIGALILVSSTMFIVKWLGKQNQAEKYAQKYLNGTTIFFQISFVACYLAGMNYDYRMFLLIGACIGILISRRDLPGLKFLTIVSIASMWQSSYFFGQVGMSVIYQQLIGDIAIGLAASYIAAIMVKDSCTYLEVRYLNPNKHANLVSKIMNWARW